MGRRWGYREGDLPVTERVGDTLVRLPFYYGLMQQQQEIVAEAVYSAL